MHEQKVEFNLREVNSSFRNGQTEGDIVNEMGIPRSTFVYHYKIKSKGKTPMEFKKSLARKAVEKSKKHLWKKPYREVVEESGLPMVQFRNIFKEITGRTPQGYIKWLRMKEAKRVLANYGSPPEAQRAAKYKYLHHFDNDFRKSTGITPTQYRNKFMAREMKRLLRELKQPGEVVKEFDKWSDDYLKFVFRKDTGMSMREYRGNVFLDRIKNLLEKQYKICKVQKKLDLKSIYWYTFFKKMTGMTPTEYQHNVLVERAEKLLVKYEPGEVRKKVCGRRSQTYFYNHIVKEFGMSPGQYRRILTMVEAKMTIPQMDRIDKVCKKIGYSQSHLTARFKKELEISPIKYKEYAKQTSRFMSMYYKSQELQNLGRFYLPA